MVQGRVLPQDGGQKGMRAILRLPNLLPFRQVLGIKNVVNAFIRLFPEE